MTSELREKAYTVAEKRVAVAASRVAVPAARLKHFDVSVTCLEGVDGLVM